MTPLFERLLSERDYLMADGAIGTNLFAMGLLSGDAPELWNTDKPANVRALHDSFVEAGADLLVTNTFGANRYRLMLHDAQDRAHELNYEGVRLAREAADAVDRPVIVAASMGPTGEIFQPVGALSIEDGEAAFAEQARAQAEAGADVHWIETISGREELTAAVRGASVTGLPVVSTMTFDTVGRTMMGLTPEDAVALKNQLSNELLAQGKTGVLAFGANCGVGPSTLVDTVLGIDRGSPEQEVIVAKGNCGIPAYEDGKIVYSGSPEIMANYARMARDAGARIIGGCCGTTAAHVKAMVDALKDYTPGEKPSRHQIEATLGPIDSAPVQPEGTEEGGRQRRRSRRRS